MTKADIDPQTVEGFGDEWMLLNQCGGSGRCARMAGGLGRPVDNMPLSAYRDWSFYVMRTDALDRLDTRLKQRFAQSQIGMMENAGLTPIVCSPQTPYRCAVGYACAVPESR